jgi:hypothetical protein
MNGKVRWVLIVAQPTEAHVVCVCGDVSVHISEDDLGFHLSKRVKGIWVRVYHSSWPDLPAAMAEAELICKGEA